MNKKAWVRFKKKQKQEKERIEREKIESLVNHSIDKNTNLKDNKIPKKWYEVDGKYWKGFLRGVAIISFCWLLYGIYVAILKPDKKKFEEDNIATNPINYPTFSTGGDTAIKLNFKVDSSHNGYPIIRGLYIKDFDKKESIILHIGNQMSKQSPLKYHRGLDALQAIGKCDIENKLVFAVYQDRIYIHAKFYDLKTGYIIGEIEFNHWTLYKKNLLVYSDSDTSLEVKDHYGNVVFALKYPSENYPDTPNIYMGGYFAGLNNILVIINNFKFLEEGMVKCISKKDNDWELKASKEIEKIYPIF